MTLYVLGVDGGMSGALALLGSDGSLMVTDTPCNRIKSGDGWRHELDAITAIGYFRMWPMTYAFFEKGQELVRVGEDGQRRRQKGMYDYGFTNGALYGAALVIGAICTIVTPQDWKRKLHLLGKDKEASRALATELWPDGGKNIWPAKSHHNRAEAALIAKFGMDSLQGALGGPL